jgi:hypothetical protein
VWNWKPERWGSSLGQGRYQEESLWQGTTMMMMTKIIIRDYIKKNMHVDRCCSFWRQKCDQESSREDFKISRSRNIKLSHVECESKRESVIIGATGTISKSLRQHLSIIPGKHEI